MGEKKPWAHATKVGLPLRDGGNNTSLKGMRRKQLGAEDNEFGSVTWKGYEEA